MAVLRVAFAARVALEQIQAMPRFATPLAPMASTCPALALEQVAHNANGAQVMPPPTLAITPPAAALVPLVRELQHYAQDAPLAHSFTAAMDSAMALVRTAPATTHLEVTPWDALELPMELARRAQAQVAPLACTRARCVARQAI